MSVLGDIGKTAGTAAATVAGGGAAGAALQGIMGLFGGGTDPITADLTVNKLFPQQKSALEGYIFGPQNFNPDALLGTGSFSGLNNNTPYNGWGTNPQQTSMTQGYGGVQSNNLTGTSVPASTQQSSAPQPGSMVAPPQGQQSGMVQGGNGYVGGYGQPNGGAQGQSLADLISNPALSNGQVKAGGGMMAGMDAGQLSTLFPGKSPGEITKLLISMGYDPGKMQDALQTGGFSMLANANTGANAFGTNLANTIGNTQTAAMQSQQAGQQNVDALRNAVTSGSNQFQNYFQNNVSDLGGFDDASNYLKGIDLSGATNAANRFGAEAGQNVNLGRDISSGALSDTDYLRSLLGQDRTLRDSMINQSLGFNVSPELTSLANDLYSQNITLGQNDLNNGTTSEAFRRQMLDAQNALADRGLGTTSSAFSDAAGRVQQQRDVLNSQLVNQELSNRTKTIIDQANLNKQLANQAAGLTNQSSTAFAGNLSGLYNAASGGLSASNDAINSGLQSGNLLNNIAQTGVQIGTGLGNVAGNKSQAANNAASTLLRGNELTQTGLGNVATIGNQIDQTSLNALLQSGQLSNAGINSMTNLGQLGLDTQAQGFNEATAQLQAIMDEYNNRQRRLNVKEAAAQGLGLTA